MSQSKLIKIIFRVKRQKKQFIILALIVAMEMLFDANIFISLANYIIGDNDDDDYDYERYIFCY